MPLGDDSSRNGERRRVGSSSDLTLNFQSRKLSVDAIMHASERKYLVAPVVFGLETLTPRRALVELSPVVADAICRYPSLDWPAFGSMRT